MIVLMWTFACDIDGPERKPDPEVAAAQEQEREATAAAKAREDEALAVYLKSMPLNQLAFCQAVTESEMLSHRPQRHRLSPG